MAHAFSCRCGTVRGELAPHASSRRVVCYCRDCQAYARHLGSEGIVDAAGGTEVVASLPGQLRFTAGGDALACVSLSERGILRWYAGCCRTPIGNTPRTPKMAYVGVVASCLAKPLDASFGPLRMAVNTGSALRPVAKTPLPSLLAGMAGLMTTMAAARLSGRWRDNPFFAADHRSPTRPTHVLGVAERERAYRV